jgi:hypothetical protein
MSDETRPEGFKPELGLLPRIPGRAELILRALGVPQELLPTPPVELHNIERDAADSGMYGNDVQGNCMFVAIEKNRVLAALALGVTITKLTAQQVIDKYQSYTGVHTAPGPGAVAQVALNWVRKSTGWGGNKLLFFAVVPHTELAIRQACSEFQSVITCEEIRAPQEWPAKVWDLPAADVKKPVLGGHATAGGTYTKLYDFVKTWGYMVEVTPSFFAGAIDEIDVLVWDFQWASLTYARQLSLIADIQGLTGKAWDGPAPVAPVIPEAIAVTPNLLTKAIRLLDTRKNIGIAGRCRGGVARRLQVAGIGGIPANAVGVMGNLTVLNQSGAAIGGWIAATSSSDKPGTSSLQIPNSMRDNFTASLLDATGGLWFYLSAGASDVLFDPTGFFTA